MRTLKVKRMGVGKLIKTCIQIPLDYVADFAVSGTREALDRPERMDLSSLGPPV